MYSEITANKRQTTALIIIFSALVLIVGWGLGNVWGDAISGIIIAVIVATVMNLVGYYQGDAVALTVSGAKLIEKADNPQLFNTVENLAITAGIPTPKIYLINDSSPNAFATGRDPQHASVALTTGLLQTMNPSELEGVIAHEFGHIKNYDIRLMTLVVILVGTILLLSDILLRSMWSRGRRNNDGNGQTQLVLLLIGLILAIISPLIAELLKLAISRKREYLADASGALLTRYPEGLASALEKIATYDQPLQKANHATAHLFLANPFDPKVTKKFEQWFSTHPPIEERIARLRKMGN